MSIKPRNENEIQALTTQSWDTESLMLDILHYNQCYLDQGMLGIASKGNKYVITEFPKFDSITPNHELIFLQGFELYARNSNEEWHVLVCLDLPNHPATSIADVLNSLRSRHAPNKSAKTVCWVIIADRKFNWREKCSLRAELNHVLQNCEVYVSLEDEMLSLDHAINE